MAEHRLIAEVAGAVFRMDTDLGRTVRADDPVLTLECMKMEIPALSPVSGRVIQFMVSEGDMVEEGQLLAVIDA